MERIILGTGPLNHDSLNHGSRFVPRVDPWSEVLILVQPYLAGALIVQWFDANPKKVIGVSAIETLYGWEKFRISKLGRILRDGPEFCDRIEEEEFR